MSVPLAPIQAWVYPGPPACSAADEFSDGRAIDTIKAEYFALSDAGVIAPTSDQQCNGYSYANAMTVKAHSRQQFATISGSIAGMVELSGSLALLHAASDTLLTFLRTTQFTGIELDIEDYSSWTAAQYSAYQHVVSALGSMLHASGPYQLMIDGPAIINATYQGYYLWRYEDFNRLPVDSIVSMCYDFQDDAGVGTPIAPLANITDCCNWMRAKITDPSRIVIGLNSYGYTGVSGAYTATIQTYEQMKALPGFDSAVRDPSSGEMMWASAGKSYDYSDSTTLDLKRQAVLATGLATVSVWHLGGNAWFSLHAAPAAPTGDPLLAAFHAAYPAFAQWYASRFDQTGRPRG